MYDAASLKEKEIYFQKFLNGILANEELRASKYLELFLTCPNENKFKPIRKKYEKNTQKPVELSQFSNIDGKVSINVNPANMLICKNYGANFISKFQSVFKNLEEATEEIENNSMLLGKSIK